jgi:hypothetical protein
MVGIFVVVGGVVVGGSQSINIILHIYISQLINDRQGRSLRFASLSSTISHFRFQLVLLPLAFYPAIKGSISAKSCPIIQADILCSCEIDGDLWLPAFLKLRHDLACVYNFTGSLYCCDNGEHLWNVWVAARRQVLACLNGLAPLDVLAPRHRRVFCEPLLNTAIPLHLGEAEGILGPAATLACAV